MEVYRVDSKETGELLFIAAWEDAKVDWSNQLGLLRKKLHPIVKLQDHFNKHGEVDMVFSSVKKVSNEKEQIKVIVEAKEKKVKVQKGQVKEEVPEEVLDKLPDKETFEEVKETTEEIPEVEEAVVEEPEMEKAVIKTIKKRKPRK
jgi:hypothetical protein